MTQEIVRALVDGVWVTEVASQGGGGGGISEITSDDHTVTVTNPSGPTVDLSASGGSQTLAEVLNAGNDAEANSIVGLNEARAPGGELGGSLVVGGGVGSMFGGGDATLSGCDGVGALQAASVVAGGHGDSGGKVLIDAPGGLFITGDAPEVPAVPTAQDVVDALVVIGLITQAAP